jgi:hypothetical protein
MNIYVPSPPQATTNRTVSGRYLAHNRLTARARARLADDIASKRSNVSDLTLRQAAKLCRVSVSSVKAARRSPADSLVAAWKPSNRAERLQFAHRVGVGEVWADAVEPAINDRLTQMRAAVRGGASSQDTV